MWSSANEAFVEAFFVAGAPGKAFGVERHQLILDLAVEDGLARAKSRQHNDTEDRYERMEIDFHRRLRDGYLEIAKSNPDRCVIIDATKDVEAVSEAIQQAILAKGL